ncbi:hypothetical protein KC363_g5360 [Hortaea werneckii]|uniref:Uncharacterized protein n=1 Tax=Hortaea werneckii TaxID=91943 RepID=A0A3M7FTI8_HORWE|nr:hypothetical protein KC361_g3321 [Hortaea werneckii]KAI6885931.1 hypothetical protein KC325_g3201 [Hortaea werneckii]KAI6995594.1 hypothetical protein KC359_g4018 [Hortaea werneckii]KAI7147307.1 hypothetical protein KC344_g2918 [Hortaea werneckii]KAI7170097.1 hypothetical protein KC360_g7090 [Hortaea werneckii]
MSSGNPFRRAPPPPSQSSGPSDESSLRDQDDRPVTPPKDPKKAAKKKKKVVIMTPPHSPEEPPKHIPPRLSDGMRVASPPPSTKQPASALTLDQLRQLKDEGHADTDSITSADSDLQEAIANTRKNSGTGVLPPPAVSFGVNRPIDKPAPYSDFGAQSETKGTAEGGSEESGGRAGGSGGGGATSGAPANPFARTLQTQEAGYGLQKTQSEEDRKVEAEGGRRGRQTLDVDAFKNLLMTGSATPSPPAGQSPQPQQRNPDINDSASKETNADSRPSMFDTQHETDVPHPESPRTSFDDGQFHEPSSEDEDEEVEENEHSSILGPQSSRPVAEGPPRPPKHTHGRAYPQTVSFADFDTDLPPSAPRTPPANKEHQPAVPNQGPKRPSLSRHASDLNKPLPAPPQGDATADAASHSNEQQAQQNKRPPPPPPASRRQGQGTTPQGRARSTSNLSQNSSIHQADSETSSLRGAESGKAVPPPPPSRRSHQQPATSHAASPAIETPPAAPSPGPAASAGEGKAVPPPPPRRSMHAATAAAGAVNRTPSNSSRSSIPRSESVSGSTSTANQPAEKAPPAPPPRRGGATKRNSMDGPPNALNNRRASGERRVSGQSLGSDTSSLKQVGEGTEENGLSEEGKVAPDSNPSSPPQPPERDILADMQAFQDEIEALRKAQHGGG